MEALGGAFRGEARRRPARRARGHIERLPSGSARVKVYAGRDALTRRSLYLTELVPAGPDLDDRAEQARAALVAKITQGDHPRTDATIDDLMDRHLAEAKLSRKTRATYLGYHRKHITPLLGKFKINGAVDPELLDVFYAELARCRDHCTGKPTIKHWTPLAHACADRCRRHECRPLGDWTIRKIHWMLNGAYKRAVRWKWALINPMAHAEPPPPPPSNPSPPTTEEAARIVTAAWHDLDYGRMVWTGMITGARLGELCALRWRDFQVEHVDPNHVLDGLGGYDCLEAGCQWVLSISRSIEHLGLEVWETDTKTHQHRRVALDPEAVAVLLDLREIRAVAARASAREVSQDDFIFHHRRGPDVCLRPGAVSTHYRRFTAKLGIATTFHKLRHYSATELILAGVDVRTVAGRLGHSGGGTTTLKIYAAWRSEADQRAAVTLGSRVPTPPASGTASRKRARFEVVAERLRDSILQGHFTTGAPLPTMKQLASAHRVSINSAHAAVGQLAAWGYVTVSRGKRAVITDPSCWPARPADEPTAGPEAIDEPRSSGDPRSASQPGLAPVVGHIGAAPDSTGTDHADSAQHRSTDSTELLQLRLRCNGNVLKTLCTEANIADARDVQRLVRDVAATLSDDLAGVLELDIARFGSDQPILTYVMGQAATARQRLVSAG